MKTVQKVKIHDKDFREPTAGEHAMVTNELVPQLETLYKATSIITITANISILFILFYQSALNHSISREGIGILIFEIVWLTLGLLLIAYDKKKVDKVKNKEYLLAMCTSEKVVQYCEGKDKTKRESRLAVVKIKVGPITKEYFI